MPLFQAEDLSAHLGTTVDDGRAEAVERLVWGWLKPVLSLTERPDPVPDEVFSWAIELAGIAYRNPTGLLSKQLGPAELHFSIERRDEILDEAGGVGTPGVTPALAPRGRFPEARPYPDPACW